MLEYTSHLVYSWKISIIWSLFNPPHLGVTLITLTVPISHVVCLQRQCHKSHRFSHTHKINTIWFWFDQRMVLQNDCNYGDRSYRNYNTTNRSIFIQFIISLDVLEKYLRTKIAHQVATVKWKKSKLYQLLTQVW